jgi:type IV pilus assembly protein PilB
MAKYNLDDILNELGVDDGKSNADARPAPVRKPHAIDKQSGALSPVPAAPANQGAPSHPAPPPTPPPTPATPGAPAQQAQPPEAKPTKDSASQAGEGVKPPSSVAPGPAISEIYRPEPEGDSRGRTQDLIALLTVKGAPADKLAQSQGIIKQSPHRSAPEILIEQGLDEVLIQSAVAELAGLPFERVDLDKGLDGGFDGKMLQRLGPDFCRTHLVMPLRTEGQRVVLGVVRPDEVFLFDEVKTRLGVAGVKLVLITAFDIRGVLEVIGEGVKEQDTDINDILEQADESDVQVEKKQVEETDLERAAGENPVIRIVNHIIQTAVNEGASDIHIEPSEKKLKVRYRIDGELFEILNPPASMSAAVTSRLKIMANLDISERRLPQDGRIRCMVGGRRLDLRMSTLPSGHGEKTVLRILDTRSIQVELNQLGFDEDTFTIWRKAIDAPHGINLVTGPTGSGKTTTLYASLRTVDCKSMNISTVEDPIEYHLDGITQTQMHEKIGMTFAAALRSLLRQDPDVIMLGEIRDLETAQIAVQAALTGHLVLSTLHTNDAPSSITRLVNIGLEPFLVGAAVNAVLAQRLIRRLCLHCKSEEQPSEEMAEFLQMQGLQDTVMWKANGCDRCRKTGFSGRVGIYELLSVDDQLRDIVARNPNVAEFRRLCIERGMVTLRADGMRKVAKGLTTVSEVLRVTESH